MHYSRNNVGALLAPVLLAALNAQAAATLTPAALDHAYDRTGFESAKLVVAVDGTTGTPDSFSVTAKLYHSDTLTGADFVQMTDAAGANVSIAAVAAGVASLDVDLTGAKKYIAADVVVAFVNGTSPKVNGSFMAILGGAQTIPAVAPSNNAVA